MVTLGLKLAPGQPNNFCTNSERRAGAYRALLGWLRTHKAARVRFVPHGVAFAHVAARSSGAPPYHQETAQSANLTSPTPR
jgi:hypothetical protein